MFQKLRKFTLPKFLKSFSLYRAFVTIIFGSVEVLLDRPVVLILAVSKYVVLIIREADVMIFSRLDIEITGNHVQYDKYSHG